MAPRHSELSFKDIFPSCSPRDPQGGLCLPTWLLTGWRGRIWDGGGASLSLISVKFAFWKERSSQDRVCSAMVGGRHGENPPGGLMWLLLEPTDLSRSCSCFHFFCLESLLFPLFQSMETQVSLPPSSGAAPMEKCRMGQSPSLFPARGCTSHLPPAPGMSSSLPPAVAQRQILPGVQVTPRGWFGPRLVPDCLP